MYLFFYVNSFYVNENRYVLTIVHDVLFKSTDLCADSRDKVEILLVFGLSATIKPVGTIYRIDLVIITKKVVYWI